MGRPPWFCHSELGKPNTVLAAGLCQDSVHQPGWARCQPAIGKGEGRLGWGGMEGAPVGTAGHSKVPEGMGDHPACQVRDCYPKTIPLDAIGQFRITRRKGGRGEEGEAGALGVKLQIQPCFSAAAWLE